MIEANSHRRIHEEVTYGADLLGNRVDALVSTTEHHLVDYDLLCAQDDTIRANNSASSAVYKKSQRQGEETILHLS